MLLLAHKFRFEVLSDIFAIISVLPVVPYCIILILFLWKSAADERLRCRCEGLRALAAMSSQLASGI